jgi:hypothetical protein
MTVSGETSVETLYWQMTYLGTILKGKSLSKLISIRAPPSKLQVDHMLLAYQKSAECFIVSRDVAKIFNYGRIYGSGVRSSTQRSHAPALLY